MKPFSLLRIGMVLVGFAVGLLLTPACKAQAEIAPDHFDGTDSWETQLHKVIQAKPRQTLVALHSDNSGATSLMQLKTERKPKSSPMARKKSLVPLVKDRRRMVSGKPREQ